jgi:glutathione S-transferase
MNFTEIPSDGEVTVGYWAIRGLGAPLRMMTMYKGIRLNAVNYDLATTEENGFDRSSWYTDAKPALKEQNPLVNLPYVIDNGLIITQSHACLVYLGRRLGLLGNSPAAEIECEQLLCEYMDFRNHVVGFVYAAGGNIPEFIEKHVNAPNGQLYKLNLWLEKKYGAVVPSSENAIFFVGDSATAPDFAIWEIIDQFIAMAKFVGLAGNPLESKMPFLQAFHASFAQLPGNAHYLASALYALPANNLSAKTYGGTPSGAVWEFGMTQHTWKGSSGIY